MRCLGNRNQIGNGNKLKQSRMVEVGEQQTLNKGGDGRPDDGRRDKGPMMGEVSLET